MIEMDNLDEHLKEAKRETGASKRWNEYWECQSFKCERCGKVIPRLPRGDGRLTPMSVMRKKKYCSINCTKLYQHWKRNYGNDR